MAKLVTPGDAQASHVIEGKNFNAGVLYDEVGTMASRSGHIPSTAITVWQGDKVFLRPPVGYIGEDSWIFAAATDFVAANIRSDKNILGVQGTMPVRENDKLATIARYERVGRAAIGFSTGAYVNNSGFGDGIASVAVEDSGLNPANVRSDVTILGMRGSMPVRPSQQPALSTGEYNSSVYARIPLGAYVFDANGGNAEIVVPYSMLANNQSTKIRSENIRSGVWIYGVQGTLVEGKPYATGNHSSSSAWTQMTISGLSFRPRVIIIRSDAGSYAKQYVYSPNGRTDLNGLGLQWNPNEMSNTTATWSIVPGSFTCYFGMYQQTNTAYNWEAYG